MKKFYRAHILFVLGICTSITSQASALRHFFHWSEQPAIDYQQACQMVSQLQEEITPLLDSLCAQDLSDTSLLIPILRSAKTTDHAWWAYVKDVIAGSAQDYPLEACAHIIKSARKKLKTVRNGLTKTTQNETNEQNLALYVNFAQELSLCIAHLDQILKQIEHSPAYLHERVQHVYSYTWKVATLSGFIAAITAAISLGLKRGHPQ